MNNDKYYEAIEKLALGYDYEETQILIDETKSGQKKRMYKTKKHIPPNFEAARFMINHNKKKEKEAQENIEEFDTLDFDRR